MQFKMPAKTDEQEFVRQYFLRGQYTIYAHGEVVPGTADRFIGFVKEKSIQNGLVFFNSPGGSLIEGLKLGKAIRELGFDTAIGSISENNKHLEMGICASACAYAFAGGVYRYYHNSSGKLGIHQFYNGGDNQGDIGDSQVISGTLVNYLQSMGVDANAFVLASVVRSNEIIWLTEQQAEQLGFINNGATKTTVELKLGIEHPYLKLEQGRRDASARLLFECNNSREIVVMAGIVTSPELTQQKNVGIVQSFLESSEKGQFLIQEGNSGVMPFGSVLWITRKLERSNLNDILESTQLGIWTADKTAFNWGAIVDLTPYAKQKIVEFSDNCFRTN